MNTIFQRLSDRISKSLSKQTNKRINTVSNESPSNVQKIYCRFCGKGNLVSLEYCVRCRMATAVPPSQIMKVCKKCGLAVNDDSVYCYSCGTKFDDVV
jgi:membrane protease subunit (stomatin/prohibitin family)